MCKVLQPFKILNNVLIHLNIFSYFFASRFYVNTSYIFFNDLSVSFSKMKKKGGQGDKEKVW